MSITQLDRFKLRGGLAAALASLNEIPLRREMIVELDNLFTTGEFRAKIGDGVTSYNDLPYLAMSAAVTISDIAPPSPEPGQSWIDSTDGTMYTYYVDGDTQQWVEF